MEREAEPVPGLRIDALCGSKPRWRAWLFRGDGRFARPGAVGSPRAARRLARGREKRGGPAGRGDLRTDRRVAWLKQSPLEPVTRVLKALAKEQRKRCECPQDLERAELLPIGEHRVGRVPGVDGESEEV